MATYGRPILERLLERTDKAAPGGCWLWLGAKLSNGYGVMSIGRRNSFKVHRLMYEQLVGRIPEGLVIDHLCRVRDCINPAHLRAVTQRENVLAPGSLSPSKSNSEKTHCPRGHALKPGNLVEYQMRIGGGRSCLTCAHAASRRSSRLRTTLARQRRAAMETR